MKRWIHSSVSINVKERLANAKKFCSEVNDILRKGPIGDYCKLDIHTYYYNVTFNLRLGHTVEGDLDAIGLWVDDRQDVIKKFWLSEDANGAALYITDIVEKAIRNNQLVTPSEFDDFLSNYSSYLDAVSDTVEYVAVRHDSDMCWDWRSSSQVSKRYLVNFLLDSSSGSVCFDTNCLIVTHALGMAAVAYKGKGLPEQYETKDGALVTGPSDIYYKGNPIYPKLKQFDADLNRLEVALEDYFKDLEYMRDNVIEEMRKLDI